jgi:putative NADH-flavin reductase
MQLASLGATRGVGLELVKQAVVLGHEVTVLARTPSKLDGVAPGLRVVQGDATDPAAVASVVAGQDGVLVALGSGSLVKRDTVCSEGTRHALAAMTGRLVVCSSYGASETRSELPLPIRLLLRLPLADKDVQEALVRASSLAWVIVRPAGLTDAPRTGKVVVALPGTPLGGTRRIGRADVAAFMLQCLQSDTYLRQCPAIGS